ncbi:MAG: GNAT family N-acetyltransferase [Bacteroidaceae bacterium]|nr:GNAT family N-acetyltransferase [Bacteroidaceae bacterium]
MNIIIKEATLEQIPIIQQLAQESYPVAYAGIHSEEQNLYMMQRMYNTESLAQQMTEQHSHFLLLYADGVLPDEFKMASRPCEEVPLGYCAYKRHATEACTLYIDKLYILPSQKGKGYGRLLVQQVVDVAQQLFPQGYAIRLDVNRSNSARTFYEHLGFHVLRSWDAPIGNDYYMNAYEMEMVKH